MASLKKQHQRLLSETRQRISQLEEAITQVNATKKHLKQNAVEVKCQIHSAMSRQLESLRNREVWLLNQVDVIQQAKEDVLRQQQDRLQRVLGGLQNSLELSEDEGEPAACNLDKKLSSSLDRLDELDLRPQESPNIGFKANVSDLKDAIHAFGRVDSKGLPLDNVFAGPESSSTSLPKAFEDYGDAEHHVLYKTVEEIKQEKCKDSSIHVNIPKLAQGGHSWLFTSVPTNPGVENTVTKTEGRFQFPPFQAEWMNQHEDMSAPSIQHWLTQLKHEPEVEDDDFELIQQEHTPHTVSESSESIVMLSSSDEEPPQKRIPESNFSYFHEIATTPIGAWITGGQTKVPDSVPYLTLQYFKEVANSTKRWLGNFEKKQQDAEKGGYCKGQCSPVHQPMALDIENLDKIMCIQESVSKYFRELTSQKEAWLSEKGDDSDADVDEMEVDGVANVCKANEPCQSFEECISEDNCCQLLSSLITKTKLSEENPCTVMNPALQEWLVKPKKAAIVEDLMASPLFTYFKSIPQSASMWLDCSEEPCDVIPAQDLPLNLESTVGDTTEWLYRSEACQTPESPASIGNKFREIATSQDCDWLKRSQPASNKNSPCITDENFVLGHVSGESSQWLRSCSIPVGAESDRDWLVSSGRNSQNDEPHEKDWGTEVGEALFREFKKSAQEKKWILSPSNSTMNMLSDHSCDSNYTAESVEKKAFSGYSPMGETSRALPEGEEEDSVWLMKKENSSEKLANLGRDLNVVFPEFADRGVNLGEWLMNARI